MVVASNGKVVGFMDFLLAEALSWIKALNLNKVIVETDALMLVQAFSASAYNFSLVQFWVFVKSLPRI